MPKRSRRQSKRRTTRSRSRKYSCPMKKSIDTINKQINKMSKSQIITNLLKHLGFSAKSKGYKDKHKELTTKSKSVLKSHLLKIMLTKKGLNQEIDMNRLQSPMMEIGPGITMGQTSNSRMRITLCNNGQCLTLNKPLSLESYFGY